MLIISFIIKAGIFAAVSLLTITIMPLSASAHKAPLFSPYRFEVPQATIRIKDATNSDIWTSAINKWNKSQAFKFVKTSSGSAQIQADSYSSMKGSNRDITGITYSYTNTASQLLSANVRLNIGPLNKYHYTRSQRINVAEHELGHSMGLLHDPSSKSVMYYRNRYVSIQPVDIAAVKNDYATLHFDDIFQSTPVTKKFTDPVNKKRSNKDRLFHINPIKKALILASQATHAELTYVVK